MEINKVEFIHWLAALRSGEFKQTRCNLNDSFGYCCLGVACRVLIPENKLGLNEKGFIEGGYPGSQEHAPEWLRGINRDLYMRYGKTLVTLNDTDKLTFTEIADILEITYLHDIKD